MGGLCEGLCSRYPVLLGVCGKPVASGPVHGARLQSCNRMQPCSRLLSIFGRTHLLQVYAIDLLGFGGSSKPIIQYRWAAVSAYLSEAARA